MNKNFLFEQTVKAAHDPVDANTAAITGARIKLDKGERVVVLAHLADSVSATAVQYTLRQHNAATAGTSKNLLSDNPYYLKAGAETVFTKIVPSSPTALIDVTTQLASEPGILVIDVLPEQLDTNNGFAWFSVDIADAGAAKIVSTQYIIVKAGYSPAHELAV